MRKSRFCMRALSFRMKMIVTLISRRIRSGVHYSFIASVPWSMAMRVGSMGCR